MTAAPRGARHRGAGRTGGTSDVPQPGEWLLRPAGEGSRIAGSDYGDRARGDDHGRRAHAAHRHLDQWSDAWPAVPRRLLKASPPTTLEGIERYLGSGMIRGIGAVYAMLARNLLYTGVTHGKHPVVLVGQRQALAIAVRNQGARHRWSKLGEWLANSPAPVVGSTGRVRAAQHGRGQPLGLFVQSCTSTPGSRLRDWCVWFAPEADLLRQ
jgi:hypothetical protein